MSTNTKGIYYSTSADAPVTEEARSLALANSIPVGPNYVINGAFDYWQRGTSFSAAGYTADRWRTFANDTVTRQSFSSTPEVPNALYYLRFQPAQSGGYHAIQQIIENGASLLSGKTATLSFWARSNTGNAYTLTVFSALMDDTESGTGSTSVGITTTWARYSMTYVLPVTSQVTNNRYVRFVTPGTGTTYGLDIANVQFEEGASATTFRRSGSNIQDEFAACQRYFQTCYMQARGYGTVATVDTGASSRFTYPVTMRVSPTITQTGVSKAGSPAGYDSFFEGADASGVTYTYRHGNASGSGGLYYTVSWTANAEL